MTLPLIGITSGHANNQYGQPAVQVLRTYIREVIKAGGIPLVIPSETPVTMHRELYKRLDGIILTGGDDIGIENFNGEQHPTVHKADIERDRLEISLTKIAAKGQKPFLGICRGIQTLNVALGGDLYTHIQDQHSEKKKHNYYPEYPRDLISHPVSITKGSKLFEIVGEKEIQVNSLHHQGIKTLASQLVATAYAPDGIIEAAELPEHPFGIAVQWHPEWIPEKPASQAIFNAFIAAAAK
ncbi:MAG: gamma-glutamyl-gamma-aminobutyrate hydrolase family protein [Anaerolineae bacterium]|nr:gamma-glutamyl-gamma-aminobutyrate hydrolase family protein [Anaerolineae bacterium]MBT7070222.1 gamma-glutamyl-gamma-aminobutyrate hydrolase family protein [Anaerolineae bacterium]MBT7324953.1 gamma-glutamyl-gamma-aminobutyrate hydrolase family protein [Anaerolineae bacterium]